MISLGMLEASEPHTGVEEARYPRILAEQYNCGNPASGRGLVS
jgi:hypothetical protein